MFLNLPQVLVSEIIYFLDNHEFYKLMLSCKGIYDDYKRLRDDGDIYKWLHIYLQIDRKTILSKDYHFILSRSGNRLKDNIYDFTKIYNTDINEIYNGRIYNYTNVCFNSSIRNIRFYNKNISYTQTIDNKFIRYNKELYTTTNGAVEITRYIGDLLDRPYGIKPKNKYYIIYNDSSQLLKNKNILKQAFNYIYSEWDFNGIYICSDIEEIIDTLIIIVKKGILRKYKWMDKNPYDNNYDYINDLLKYTNKQTISFLKQLRYAPIYCNRMYMIRLINRWKRIYEYGTSHFGEHDSHNLIETNLNGEEKYVKTDSIFNINGINKGKRDISIRIDEYFF